MNSSSDPAEKQNLMTSTLCQTIQTVCQTQTICQTAKEVQRKYNSPTKLDRRFGLSLAHVCAPNLL